MSESPPALPRRRDWYALSAAAFRWVHIYVSMLGFATLMFFAFTGLTLNHPTWFGAAQQSTRDEHGQLPSDVYVPGKDVDRLAVAEWLRDTHHLSGRVAEFTVDEAECMIVFKGPGYSVDLFLNRDNGTYQLTETTTGAMAVLNDLHKGRDTGTPWSWVIDLSAIITMLMSISGFGLLFYIRRRRVSGVVTAVVGTVLLIVVWALWVP